MRIPETMSTVVVLFCNKTQKRMSSRAEHCKSCGKQQPTDCRNFRDWTKYDGNRDATETVVLNLTHVDQVVAQRETASDD